MKSFKSCLFLGVLSLSQFAFSQGISSKERVTCTSQNRDVNAVIYYGREQVPTIQLTTNGRAEFPVALKGDRIILGGPITRLFSADNDYKVQINMDIQAKTLVAHLRVASLNLAREGKTALNCYVK